MENHGHFGIVGVDNRIATIISERISSMNHYTQVGTKNEKRYYFSLKCI